jgi:hypothetical protein
VFIIHSDSFIFNGFSYGREGCLATFDLLRHVYPVNFLWKGFAHPVPEKGRAGRIIVSTLGPPKCMCNKWRLEFTITGGRGDVEIIIKIIICNHNFSGLLNPLNPLLKIKHEA